MARFSIRFPTGAATAAARILWFGRRAAGRRGALALALCLAGQTARAEEVEEPRWIPSIEFAFDYFEYEAEATVENHLNPPAQEGTQTNPSQTLYFQLGGELMGPMFEGLPGRPRLFVRGGAGFKPFADDTIFKIGEIRNSAEADIQRFQQTRAREILSRCEDDIPSTCSTSAPGDFAGQGSEIEADLLSPSWYAALGVSFSVPMANHLLLQVKPSVAYSGEKIDLVGWMTTITEPSQQVFEVYRATAETSVTHHSLGAGLELALVLFRSVRPIRTAIFAEGRFLWLMSDPSVTFSDSLGLSSYTVERDDFAVRAGAGLRFSWMGFTGD